MNFSTFCGLFMICTVRTACAIQEGHPFALEKPAFHGKPTLIAAKASVRADSSMTRDKQRKRVMGKRAGDGARPAGLAAGGSQAGVGGHGAGRRAVLLRKGATLEVGAEVKGNLVDGENEAGRAVAARGTYHWLVSTNSITASLKKAMYKGVERLELPGQAGFFLAKIL